MAVSHDFDAVFREVWPRLVSLGALRTGRTDIARQLAQETMLRPANTVRISQHDENQEHIARCAWSCVSAIDRLNDLDRVRTARRRAAVVLLVGPPAGGEVDVGPARRRS